jgi:thiopeptide-type bacteriocin biosynthesis protein
VHLTEGDNKLLIDFSNILNIKVFVDSVRHVDRIVLSEFLNDVGNSMIRDNEGFEYTNECIAVIYNQEGNKSIYMPPKLIDNNIKVERSYPLGSEWIYYKIYCGIKMADKILKEVVRPLMENLLDAGLCDKWFFIRYSDPDLHIRLRLHLPNVDNIGQIISEVNKCCCPFIKDNIIHKIQTDTYSRELERYEFVNIENAEEFFWIDSESTIEFLTLLKGDDGEVLRWKYACKAVDDLLSRLSFNEVQKRNLMNDLSSSFISEHAHFKEIKTQLDTKFRALRKDVELLLETPLFNLPDFEVLEKLIVKRNIRLAKWYRNLLHPPGVDFITSIIHMMLNRIFPSKQRTNEMVVYFLLFKYYKSLLARIETKKVSEEV